MNKENTSSPKRHLNPYQDETDEAILEVFASADEKVLTTKEIDSEISLSSKQTRRRLRDLESRGILGLKETSQDLIWWLEAEVEEPITVKYPLLRIIRRRLDIQLLLLGVLIGFIGAMTIVLFVGLEATNISPLVVTRQSVLLAGIYATVIGGGATVAGILSLLLNQMLYRLGVSQKGEVE